MNLGFGAPAKRPQCKMLRQGECALAPREHVVCVYEVLCLSTAPPTKMACCARPHTSGPWTYALMGHQLTEWRFHMWLPTSGGAAGGEGGEGSDLNVASWDADPSPCSYVCVCAISHLCPGVCAARGVGAGAGCNAATMLGVKTMHAWGTSGLNTHQKSVLHN